jgi:hypothetical protein
MKYIIKGNIKDTTIKICKHFLVKQNIFTSYLKFLKNLITLKSSKIVNNIPNIIIEADSEAQINKLWKILSHY